MKHKPHKNLGKSREWVRLLSQVCRKFQGVVVKYRGNFTFFVLCDWITWLNKVFTTKMIYMYFYAGYETGSPAFLQR